MQKSIFMELDEIKSIWLSYDARIERSVRLNQRCVELLQAQKTRSVLTPILWGRIAELVSHAIVLLLLVGFLLFNLRQVPYAVSALMLMVFYVIAIINCAKQIMIISRIDYSREIVDIQSALGKLQTNMLNYTRLSVLCLPLFLAFPMVVSEAIKDLNIQFLSGFDIMRASNGNWWKVQIIASSAMLPLCIWMYSQTTPRNIQKRWVRKFIEASSGVRVRKAAEFINEMEELKTGKVAL